MKNKTHYIHRIVIAVTAIIMLSAATSLCQATDKQNTPRSSKDKTILDPARSYVDQIMPLSEEEIKRSNVLRYIADFNNDGLQDIAVSDSFTGLWGNGGGKWKLYLKRADGGYIYIAEMFFNHSAIIIKPLEKGSAKIITWHRGGFRMGRKVESLIAGQTLTKLSEHDIHLDTKEINPGTSNDDFFENVRKNPVIERCPMFDYLGNSCAWKKGWN